MTLIRRCNNCKHEYGFRETEDTGFTNGIVKIASTGYFTIIGGNDFTQRTQLILTL